MKQLHKNLETQFHQKKRMNVAETKTTLIILVIKVKKLHHGEGHCDISTYMYQKVTNAVDANETNIKR